MTVSVRPTHEQLDNAVMLRRELLAEGYTDNQIRARKNSGELVRIRHGSYVEGALWRSLSTEDRHRVAIRAVLRRAHPATVISHISAAVERGAPMWGVPLDVVHVTRADSQTGRSEAGVVHHAGRLMAADIEVVNGVP